MAYNKINPVHTYKSLSQSIEYIKNPAKTADRETGELYVSGINCNPDTAYEEFLEVKFTFDRIEDVVIAHHGKQSFRPGEIKDPAIAHQIGVTLAQSIWGERFQVLVTTHLDKAHMHNHFIVNSVSFLDGSKYHSNKKTLGAWRRKSDAMCRQHGLSVIQNPMQGAKSDAKYHVEKSGRATWRKQLAADLDLAVAKSSDRTAFLVEMRSMGYLVKQGKHLAFSPPEYLKQGKRAFIRVDSLKDEMYTEYGLMQRLAENKMRNFGFQPIRRITRRRKTVRNRKKLPSLLGRYYRYLYRMGLLQRRPKRINNYAAKKAQRQARVISEQIRYIRAHSIYSETDVAEKTADLENQIKRLERERKGLYNQRSRAGICDETHLAAVSEQLASLKKERRLVKSIGILPEAAKDCTLERANAGEYKKKRRENEKGGKIL